MHVQIFFVALYMCEFICLYNIETTWEYILVYGG